MSTELETVWQAWAQSRARDNMLSPAEAECSGYIAGWSDVYNTVVPLRPAELQHLACYLWPDDTAEAAAKRLGLTTGYRAGVVDATAARYGGGDYGAFTDQGR